MEMHLQQSNANGETALLLLDVIYSTNTRALLVSSSCPSLEKTSQSVLFFRIYNRLLRLPSSKGIAGIPSLPVTLTRKDPRNEHTRLASEVGDVVKSS